MSEEIQNVSFFRLRSGEMRFTDMVTHSSFVAFEEPAYRAFRTGTSGTVIVAAVCAIWYERAIPPCISRWYCWSWAIILNAQL